MAAKTPSPERIQKAEKAVLAAARKYGNKAAIAEYSDAEQGDLLGIAYKYAELCRRAKTPKV